MNHTISDFIIRIKNASLANRKQVVLPYSNISKEIGKVLVKEGYLENVKEETNENKKSLVASISYDERTPVLTNVIIVSKPSLRIYESSKKAKKTHARGNHTVLISTSQGVMTTKKASSLGIGGEILFEIW